MEGHIVYPARRLIYSVVFCVILSAGVVFIFLTKSALADQLHAWKLLPRPERLTELYFADHEHLPVTFSPANKQSVGFVIRNLEHIAVEYSYTLFARSGANGKEAVLDTGHVKLEHTASRTITRTITLSEQLGRRLAVGVRLEYDDQAADSNAATPKTQSIHYWATSKPVQGLTSDAKSDPFRVTIRSGLSGVTVVTAGESGRIGGRRGGFGVELEILDRFLGKVAKTGP